MIHLICMIFYLMHKWIVFNPMGLGIFDIAISSYYYHKLINMGYGEKL